MKFTKLILLACASLAAVTVGRADAAEVQYVFTGIIDLNLGGVSYSNVPLTFTGIGDPTLSHTVGGNQTFVPLTMLFADVTDYGIFPVPNTIYFFTDPTTDTAGFYDPVTVKDVLSFTSPALAGYDGKSPLPPITVTFHDSTGFATP